VKAALAGRSKLHEMNAADLSVLRGRKLHQRIGLHTGVGIVGNIGSKRRFNYTVMGDSANLASRLEGANKFYGTTILASEATVHLAGSAIAWREIDTLRVVGRSGPVRVYEPMGLAGEMTEETVSLMKLYAEGLCCWRSRDFAGACRSFERLSETDAPARFFLKRSRQLMQEPPDSGWDHIHALDSK
jgi:adenylate cyclase